MDKKLTSTSTQNKHLIIATLLRAYKLEKYPQNTSSENITSRLQNNSSPLHDLCKHPYTSSTY